jgi:proteasome lid subunit RPN8/RPN11
VSRHSVSAAAWASPWSSRFLLPDVRIDREALTAIVAHARRDAPNECCGLLVGKVGGLHEHGTAGPAKPGPHVLEAIPCSNGASDPSRRYEISPVDYFAQIKRCRRINEAQSENFAVVGAYHSHPRGGPEASETDTAQAFRDFVFVIVGLGGAARGMEIRAYTFDDQTLTPVPLTVVD